MSEELTGQRDRFGNFCLGGILNKQYLGWSSKLVVN